MAPVVRLSDVAEIRGGGSLKLTGKDFVPRGVPAWGAGGQNGQVSIAEAEGPVVILSAIGARCGKCFYVDGEWTTLANTQIISPDVNRVDGRYLWYQLDDERRWHRSGTAQPFIKPSDVKNHRILLPSLDEQRRTARVLDAAHAVRVKRRQSIVAASGLPDAVLPEIIASGSEVVALGDLCWVRGGKRLPKGDAYAAEPTPHRYLRVTDFTSGEIDANRLPFLTEETQRQIARYTVATNDIVISIAGSIGRLALIEADVADANLTENAAKLVARDVDKYDPAYLLAALRSPAAQSQISALTGQVTIGKLALYRIEKTVVPLPTLVEQQRFAGVARKVRGVLRRKHSHLAQLDALFASLQCRAFTGAL
jgi:restriction endonuclease S subunit